MKYMRDFHPQLFEKIFDNHVYSPLFYQLHYPDKHAFLFYELINFCQRFIDLIGQYLFYGRIMLTMVKLYCFWFTWTKGSKSTLMIIKKKSF